MEEREPKIKMAHEADDADDIEIIEVVGIDEDRHENRLDEGPEEEVVFEGEAEPRDAERPPDEMRDRLARLQADFENYRKRTEREKEDENRQATRSLVSRLLPVIDNLERALLNRAQSGNDTLHQGVALIHRQLLEELKREGLETIEAVGLPFDPTVHEAVATDASKRHPPNTVVEEIRRGYLLHKRLLRPAAVAVSVELPGPIPEVEGAEDR